jgi:uncharacterized membrane protein
MQKDRMLAFSDGVFAVIITIMVLDLKPPATATFESLRILWPDLCTYLISFLYVGIYWNNHHHMLTTAEKINGKILWANLHLLFWLSLIPFSTSWLGQSWPAGPPIVVYASVLFMCGIAYSILQAKIIHLQGPESELKAAVGNDYKGKLSLGIYASAIAISSFSSYAAAILTALPAAIWFIPDRRIESRY